MEQLIANTPDDTLKVFSYNALSKTQMQLNNQSEMLKAAEDGLALSNKLGFKKGVIQMTLRKAVALDIMSQFDKAIPLYDEGLKMSKIQGEKEIETKYYINIGVGYYYAGDLDLALKNYLSAYDLSKYMSKEDLAKVLNNIGIIYRIQKKYDRAEKIYLKSYELKKELKDSLGIAGSLMNLGMIYHEMGGMEDKAIQQLQGSQKIYNLLGLSYHVATSDVALGEIFHDLNNLKRAKKHLNNAWDYFKTNRSQQYSVVVLGHLGNIALKESDDKAAESYMEEALKLAREYDQKVDQLELMYGLSDIKHKLAKDAQAYEILKEASALDDTLNQTDRIKAMEEMQAKFDVKEKEKELEISQLKLNQRTRQRNIFLFGASGLTVFALTVFFFLRNRIRINRKMAAQNEEIHSQKITKLQQQNKLLALNSMIEGQEAERIRIAKDLHDSLGGLLSTVKAHFTTIQNEAKQVEKIKLTQRTNELIDEACIAVRRISHNMIPHALTLSGLPTAMEDMADNLRNEGFTVELNIREFPSDVVKTKQAMLYRLVQEVISNIRKHANAKNILIQILGVDQGLSLIIEDDGNGFDYEKAIVSGGVGLKSINGRVEFLNGTIDWDTQSGKGTTITINIPKV
ncbi:tetratricopeptide repeat-containing sensor histidine kinase [Flagellimonas onchidii]|uniref:tetratricopeptide repeat-containing sensor histidine kinase n=1 Tax=Flagellimonas onchidii TaxID=2562684 RepID=UPI001455FD97|nr:tetratricopeptide repeat protein [Allomuricauda onchidii]